jgi:hypothetical protein
MATKAIVTQDALDNVTLKVVAGKLVANDPTKVATTALGAANGVATLDSTGKIPTTQLPSSVLGGVSYQGTWDANTNTPTLASGVGTKGFYYVVAVSGTIAIDGNNNWKAGDEIIFDGTQWDQIIGGETVVRTVAGRTGDIVLSTADITDFASASKTVADAEVAPVAAQVTTLNSNVSSLSTTVTTHTSQISTLNSQVSLLSGLASPTVSHSVDLVASTVTLSVNGVSTVFSGVTLTDLSGNPIAVAIKS